MVRLAYYSSMFIGKKIEGTKSNLFKVWRFVLIYYDISVLNKIRLNNSKLRTKIMQVDLNLGMLRVFYGINLKIMILNDYECKRNP